jgi:deazaflavin-dependent oxidoreductase (nitroreductase family)
MTTPAVHPPTSRLPRWFLRTPELFFRVRLDILLPFWVMLITRGRKSGRPRPVVVDVARRARGGLWVIAADGRQAQWVRNLAADSSVVVRYRGRRLAGRALIDESVDPGDFAVRIYRDRPLYVRLIYRLMGQRVASEADVRRLAAGTLPIFIATAS